MNRHMPPVAVMLLLHIYCIAEPFRDSPANHEWLQNFLTKGLVERETRWEGGSGWRTTAKGAEWVGRILGTMPERGYGGKSPGYYIIGASEDPFTTIEDARSRAINNIDGGTLSYYKGAYVLRAIELLEPREVEARFKTTYLA